MKKGFTLIELLAVIVILAIIALIATPIVLDIIKDSKESANKRTAEMYISGVNNSIGNRLLDETEFKILDGTYEVTNKGNVCIGIYENEECTGEVIEVEINNKKPTGGYIIIENMTAIEYYLILENAVATNMKSTPHVCFKTEENQDGTLKITDYLCSKGDVIITDVVIPNEINGKSVTTIKNEAFRNDKLTSVTILDGITTIGTYSFMDNKLTSIEIPTSVTSIGSSSFNNNQLPNDQAFIYARKSDGSIDNTTIISYGGAKRDNVVIPNKVTTIGGYAFQSNKLTSITIPTSVVTIKHAAFSFNSLTSIEIPTSVTTLGSMAFNNNKLREDQAFIYARKSDGSEDATKIVSYGGEKKENVMIPEGVTIVGIYSFSYNELLSVSIPEGVTIIGDNAFSNNKLASVTIPTSVSTIQNNAFTNNQLTSVTIQGKSSTLDFTSFGTGVFKWKSGYSDANITWQS